jgi:hypothetical protein
MVFFRINMPELPDGPLFAQCFQGGEQLSAYRHENSALKFKPSDFNLTLLDEEGETVVRSEIS